MEMWRKLAAEVQMTGFLTLIFLISDGDPYAVSIGLWAILNGGVFIGPTHLNPTITLAHYLKKLYLGHIEPNDNRLFLLNILAQLIGAFIFSFIGTVITQDNHRYFDKGDNSSILEAIVAEAIFTCQINLVLIIQQEINSLLIGSLAVSMTVLVGVLTVGEISGGCFNPTVCLAVNATKYLYYNESKYMKNYWIYVVGPFIGAFLGAALGCIYIGEPKFKEKIEESGDFDDTVVPMIEGFSETH